MQHCHSILTNYALNCVHVKSSLCTQSVVSRELLAARNWFLTYGSRHWRPTEKQVWVRWVLLLNICPECWIIFPSLNSTVIKNSTNTTAASPESPSFFHHNKSSLLLSPVQLKDINSPRRVSLGIMFILDHYLPQHRICKAAKCMVKSWGGAQQCSTLDFNIRDWDFHLTNDVC